MSCQWLPLESILSGASSAVVFFWGGVPIGVFSWKTRPGKFFPGVLVLDFSNSVSMFLLLASPEWFSVAGVGASLVELLLGDSA